MEMSDARYESKDMNKFESHLINMATSPRVNGKRSKKG